ncbi:type I secretion C-terminal target domain (VC_A0849 subclass) [Devosia lucknowensis]|uniref:Type I secretion C-terminal target domain (VC_A0849 subclass) n=1 Tax=Devosia lucknowensis TaxID=1096929 RepID=A0A1Y6ECW5_9HYPH|nr:DUF5801 repeats-in-toxin domain-containing protein [Devosia lucknowensis]SMQ60375.1 type I secretion C-terminal target domain (VC_A0849 subclass) [Devosia lucknowensis]
MVENIRNSELNLVDGREGLGEVTLVAQAETPATDAPAPAPAEQGAETRVVVEIQDQVILRLPADASVDQPRVNGTDLEFVQADGSVIVVPNGAITGLTIFIGDVEIPPQTVAALFEANGIQAAAGPAGAGAQSSGGNFEVPVGGIGDAFAIGSLLDPTELSFSAPQQRDLLPGNLPPRFAFGSYAFNISEEGLAFGLADDNPLGLDTTDSTFYVIDLGASDPDRNPLSFTLSAPTEGLTSNGVAIEWQGVGSNHMYGTVNGATVIDITISGGSGFLIVNLLQPLDHSGINIEDVLQLGFVVTANDGRGGTATATITIGIEDDSPRLDQQESVGVDEDGLPNGVGNWWSDGDNPGKATSATGSLGILWGADNGDIDDTFNEDGSFAQDGGGRSVYFSAADIQAFLDSYGNLTSGGNPLVFTITSTTITASLAFGDGEGEGQSSQPIFKISLSDDGEGAYMFQLFGPLDHAPRGGQPGEGNEGGEGGGEEVILLRIEGEGEGDGESYEDDIVLNVGFTAKDADGDTIGGTFTVTIDDDLPVIRYNGNHDYVRIVDEDDIATKLSLGTSPNDGNADGSYTENPYNNETGPAIIYGSLSGVVNFGADGFGKYAINSGAADKFEAYGLSSQGAALSYQSGSDGAWATFTATAGGRTVFEFRINPADGKYEFRLFDQLDHDRPGDDWYDAPTSADQNFDLQDGSPFWDVLGLDFGSIVRAYDGDGDYVDLVGQLTIKVRDDVPELIKGRHETQIVDEQEIRTDWSTGTRPDGYPDNANDGNNSYTTVDGGAARVTGSLAHLVRSGADEALKFSFVDEAQVRSTLESLGLKSAGGVLSFDVQDGNVLWGFVNKDGPGSVYNEGQDRPVFKLTIQPDGKYTFDLIDQLDHDWADGENFDLQDKIAGELSSIDFGSVIKATDHDGDSVVLKDAFSIRIKDDVPEVKAGLGQASLSVDETRGTQSDADDTTSDAVKGLFAGVSNKGTDTDMNLGPQFATQGGVVTANVTPGADDVVSVSWSLAINGDNGKVFSGLRTTNGDKIFLSLEDGLVIGRVDQNNTGLGHPSEPAAFAIHIGANGTLSMVQYMSIQHATGDHDESAALIGNAIKAVVTVTDFDGDKDVDSVSIGNAISFQDDGPKVVRFEAKDGVRLVLDESVGTTGSTQDEGGRQNNDETLFGAADKAIGYARVAGADLFHETIDAGADGLKSKVYTLMLSGAAQNGKVYSDLTDTASGQKIILKQVGATIEGVTEFGGVRVFTVSVGADGTVSVNQFRAIKHNDNQDHDENGSDAEKIASGKLSLNLTVTDGDGDKHGGSFDLGQIIRFEDDGPSVGNNALISLEDDDLWGGIEGGTGDDIAPLNTTGFLAHEYGSDGAGSVLLVKPDALPDGFGYNLYNGDKTLIITQGGEPVIKIEITNTVTGAYKVTQLAAIDHPYGQDENNVEFSLKYKVTDGDGDTAIGTFKINVDDDSPVADIDLNYGGKLVLDESLGGSGNENDERDATWSDRTRDPYASQQLIGFAKGGEGSLFTLNNEMGADRPGSVTFALKLSAGATGLIDAQTNSAVLLKMVGTSVVGYFVSGGNDIPVFSISVDANDGDVRVFQYRALEHNDSTDHDEANSPEVLAYNLVKLEVTVTDHDGDSDSDSIDLGGRIKFEDDGPSVGIVAKSSAAIVLDESVGTTGSVQDEGGRQNNDETLEGAAQGAIGFGKIAAADLFTVAVDAGTDGLASQVYTLVIDNERSGLFDTATKSQIKLSCEDGVVVGKSEIGGHTVFTIAVAADGSVTVNQFRAIVHDDKTDHDEHNDANDGNLATGIENLAGKISLKVTVTDGDGDKASDSINLGKLISFEDDGPSISVAPVSGLSNGLFFDGFTANNNQWGQGSGYTSGTAGNWTITSSSNGGTYSTELQRVGDGYRGANSPTNSVMVDMEASPGNVAISQQINGLVANEVYRLSFEIGEASDAVAGSAKLEVFWNGVSVGTWDPNGGDMQTIVLNLVAQAGPNTLTFQEIGTSGDNTGTFLANVQINDLIIIDESASIQADSDEVAAAAVQNLFSGLVVGIDLNMQAQYAQGTGAVVASSVDYGADGKGAELAYAFSIVAGATTLKTTEGQVISLTLDGEGRVVGIYDDAGTSKVAFALHIGSGTGVVTVAQFVSLEHPVGGSSHDEGLYLPPGSVRVSVTATDGDGDKATASSDITQLIRFEDDGPSITGITADKFGAELIQNGSFENPANVPGGWQLFTSIEGWNSNGGVPFEIQSNGAGGLSGANGTANLVELDSDQDSGKTATNSTIAQTITTVAGQTYSLTFHYAARPGHAADNGMTVTVNGQSVFVLDPDADKGNGWQAVTVTFTATSASTTIAFTGTGTADEYGILLDEVSVKQVLNGLDDDSQLHGIAGGPGDDANGNIATGKINFDAGADGLKSIVATGVAGLKAILVGENGIGTQYDVAQTWEPNGKGGMLVGTIDTNGAAEGGVIQVYTLAIDASGNYTLTILRPLVHPITDNPATADIETAFEDNLDLNFGFTITDGDGDTISGELKFNVDDDTPVFGGDGIANAQVNALNSAVSGALNIAFGADGQHATNGLRITGWPQIDGIDATLSENGRMLVGKVGNTVVYELTLNSNGTYSFVQKAPIGLDTTVLHDTSLQGGFGPTATKDFGSFMLEGISGPLNGSGQGVGVANNGIENGEKLAVVFDDAMTSAKIGVDHIGNGTMRIDWVAKDANGQTVGSGSTATFNADGTLNIQNAAAFVRLELTGVWVSGPNANSTQFRIDSIGGTAQNAIDIDALTFEVSAKDGDGDRVSDTFTVALESNTAPTISLGTNDNEVLESGLSGGSTAGTGHTATGTFTIGDQDGLGDVVNVTVNGQTAQLNALVGKVFTSQLGEFKVTSYNATTGVAEYIYTLTKVTTDVDGIAETDSFDLTVSDGTLSSAPATITIEIVDDKPTANNDATSISEDGTSVSGNVLNNDVGGADGGKTVITAGSVSGAYGTLQLNADGTYTYTLKTDATTKATLQSLVPGQTLVEEFQYTMQDADGDPSSAQLTVTINGENDGVSITNLTPGANGGDAIVDEDDLLASRGNGESEGSDTSKQPTTVDGDFTVSAPDGIASLAIGGQAVITNGVFTSATITSALGNTLKVTGYDASTGVVTYKYTLNDNEAHPTGAGENLLFDDFSVVLKDDNNDTVSTTLSVKIVDDVPLANADVASVVEGGTVSGNVLTDGTPDIFGADGAATAGGVLGVATGSDTGVTANGNLGGTGIVGTYGQLTLNADGSYSYKANPNSVMPAGAVDHFVYSIMDADGDISTTTLTINVADSGLAAANEDVSVNEAALPTGSNPALSETISGNLSDNVTGGSGAKTFALDGNGAGSNGNLTLNSDGTWHYTLTSPVTTTPNANDGTQKANNVETFTYTVTDAYGNTAQNTITIDIIDDVPVANKDANTLTVYVDDLAVANVIAEWTGLSGGTSVKYYDRDGDGKNDEVRWGGGGQQSGYGFVDNSPASLNDLLTDKLFSLGKFTHYNQTIDAGTSISGATLKVNFTVLINGVPRIVGPITLTFAHNETPNDSSDPWVNADIVSISSTTSTITIDGQDYTLDVRGFTNQQGEVVNSVKTLEGQANNFDLMVRLVSSASADHKVTGDVLANDLAGADGGLAVIGVKFGANSDTNPANGFAVNGTYGKLVLNADGTYTYTLTADGASLPANASETFTYSVRDGDGDIKAADLVIKLNSQPSQVLSIAGVDTTVEEGDYAVFKLGFSTAITETIALDLSVLHGTTVSADIGGYQLSLDNGANWTSVSGSGITIPSGTNANHVLVRVATVDDAHVENDESFVLKAAVTSGNTWNSSVSGSATILDNDNFAPVAGADNIITNAGIGNAFKVPEWALLLNDTDANGDLLGISGTSGLNGLTASLTTNPGSVTINSNSPSGSFDYEVTDGKLVSNGHTSVTQDILGAIDGTDGDDIIIAGAWTGKQTSILTFASSYDVGDKVSITVDGRTFTHTVAVNKQTGEHVYDALRTAKDGNVTLESALSAKGVSWPADLSNNSAVWTSADGHSFEVATNIDNVSALPWKYEIDFHDNPNKFDSAIESISIWINGNKYEQRYTSGLSNDQRFDSAAENLVSHLAGKGFEVSYESGSNKFTVFSATPFSSISGSSTSNNADSATVYTTNGTSVVGQPSPGLITYTGTPQVTTVGFNPGGYDVGDVVSITVDGVTYNHTVAANRTSALEVFNALKAVGVGGVTLANSLSGKGVMWGNLAGNSVTLTSYPGVSFAITTAIVNAVTTLPWKYEVDFQNSPSNFGYFLDTDYSERIFITIGDTTYSATYSNLFAGHDDRFDNAAARLVSTLNGVSGISASYNSSSNTFHIESTTARTITATSTSSDTAGDVKTTQEGGVLPPQPAPSATTVTEAKQGDTLLGNGGNDVLLGDAGNDFLSGGSGDDILIGGLGSDTMHGGTGADTFVIGSDSGTNGIKDIIADYSRAEGDVVDLSTLLDGAITNDTNIGNYVRIVDSGTDATVQVDLNGSTGGENWVDVATLNNHGTVGTQIDIKIDTDDFTIKVI